MVKRAQYTILETYIRRLVEADLGSRLKDSKEIAWKDATVALRDYLERLKTIQEFRKQANDNNPSDPQQADKDFDKLRRGGQYVSGKIVGVKASSPVQFSFPTASLKTVIETWKNAAREWNEFDPIEVDEEYNVKQDSILALYKSIPYIEEFAKKQKITNEDDPFREAFESPAPQSVVSKGERPNITAGQWTPWTKDKDVLDEKGEIIVKGIPFERSQLDFKMKAGPGERLLVAELGANGPMGSGVSYDIEWNGFKYEVKAISESNYNVRAATEGIRLFSKISRTINDIFIQIKIFTEKYKEFFGSDAFTRQVNNFFAEEEEKFESGGVSEDRIKKLSAVIQSVSRRIKSLGGVLGPTGKKKISFDNKKYEVSSGTYQSILDLLGVKGDNLNDKQKIEFLSSVLKSEAFTDVDKFMEDLNYDLRPSQMFSGIVDGLFIVHPKGFYYVEISDVDNKFKFVAISQGRPEYKFIGPKP